MASHDAERDASDARMVRAARLAPVARNANGLPGPDFWKTFGVIRAATLHISVHIGLTHVPGSGSAIITISIKHLAICLSAGSIPEAQLHSSALCMRAKSPGKALLGSVRGVPAAAAAEGWPEDSASRPVRC